MNQLKFGILTVSDSCYRGTEKDRSGPKLSKEVSNAFSNVQIIHDLVEDEKETIATVLRRWSNERCAVILTTGGTGFSPRDVTPEATRSVIEKEAPGLAYAMVARGLEVTEFAMLSRAVCGIYLNTLIINLPGSPKAAAENFRFIKKALPHALALINSDIQLVEKVHGELADGQRNQSNVRLNNVALRPRTSEYPMLEVSAACDLILRECNATIQTEIVPYEESINRVLAEDIHAPEPIPSFRASVKDGYAVLSTDTEVVRKVRQTAAAGDQPIEDALQSGEAIRISTGAALPPGADAVVQVEDTSVVDKTPDNSIELSIRINKLPMRGQDIREIGSDVAQGSLLLKKFNRISHAHIGILASCGITEVRVFMKPNVGVLSTGNEVVSARESLQPGQIRDSNKPCLLHFIRKYGFTANDCGIARDIPDDVKSALNKAFSENDVVISTGGVSMGEFDILKRVLVEDFSAFIHFGRVNMKPGKPTTFATLWHNGKFKLFFGLPGNPVSCSVTAILFVIPTLRYLERRRDYQFPVVSVTLPRMSNSDSRPEYHRVTLFTENGMLKGMSTGNQTSSRLSSMVDANGLVLVSGCTKSFTNLSFGADSSNLSGTLPDSVGATKTPTTSIFINASLNSFGANTTPATNPSTLGANTTPTTIPLSFSTNTTSAANSLGKGTSFFGVTSTNPPLFGTPAANPSPVGANLTSAATQSIFGTPAANPSPVGANLTSATTQSKHSGIGRHMVSATKPSRSGANLTAAANQSNLLGSQFKFSDESEEYSAIVFDDVLPERP